MKTNKKHTVSIGIPALNEEANIQRLLKSVLAQRLQHAIIKEIIVLDDGSTDDTAKEVLSLKSKKIALIRHRSRKGITATQNDIVKKATGDVLVMLDADVVPGDDMFLAAIIDPIRKGKADLVGGQPIPVRAEGFVERVLVFSHRFKQSIYESLKNGNNIYLCHGRARAFTKRFYKNFRWTPFLPEDAYSYMYAVSKGHRFSYQKEAIVFFRCPVSIADHTKQSLRFMDSKNVLEKFFQRSTIDYEYAISFPVALKYFAIYFAKNPFLMTAFLIINFYTRLRNRDSIDHSIHAVAQSSKQFAV